MSRAQTGFGGSPIAYSEIVAWQRAMGVRFSPWEVETLKAVDAAWLIDQGEQSKAKAGEAPGVSR